MKPTDEAKRLRDEIITQLSHLILRYDADGEDRASIEGTADEHINKVLDAAVDGLESVHNPCQAVSTPAFLRIRNDAIKAINKLRP